MGKCSGEIQACYTISVIIVVVVVVIIIIIIIIYYLQQTSLTYATVQVMDYFVPCIVRTQRVIISLRQETVKSCLVCNTVKYLNFNDF